MSIQTEFLAPIREATEINQQQASDEMLVKYLNFVRRDIFAFASTFSGNNFTWNYWITDLVAGQFEYILPQGSWMKNDLKKVLSVYKKDSQWEYKKINSYDLEALPKSLEEIEKNWPDFYFVADSNSVFIYPIPLTTVPDGLKVIWSYIPDDVSAIDQMEKLHIPREYESLLWDWVKMLIYDYKKQYNEKNIAKQDYEEGKLKFKATSGEKQKILYSYDEDLSDFE